MGLKEKALANFELALALKDEHKFDAAANRLYYAVFQAVCFYAEAKLDYQWNRNEAMVKLSSGETIKGSAHQVIKGIVRKECKLKLEVFEDLLELRRRADYRRPSVGEQDLTHELVFSAQSLKSHFLERGG